VTSETTVRCSEQVLIPLAARFVDTVDALCGLELSVDEGSRGAIDLDLVRGDAEFDQLPRTVGTSPAGTDPSDERYGLEVAADRVRVWSAHPEGLFRGLTSLAQLIATNCSNRTSEIPAVRIIDGPRFAWRGLSLDVARTFFGIDEVKSVIDLLSLYKCNVLHLHLSDNEGWRLEIKSRPQLTEVGAVGATGDRPGGFYTQDEFADLVRYAADRFVTIVPEIDLPGHAGAAIRSYPELAPSNSISIGGFDLPPSALNLEDERTFDFVSDVLSETASLIPTPFLHIGGDEVFGVPDEDYERFIDRARSIVHGLGKKLIGWQEISRAGVGEGDVIQYWMAFGRSLTELFDEDGAAGSMEIPKDVASMLVEMFSKGDQDIERTMTKMATVLLSPAGVVYLDTPYAEPSRSPDQEEDRGRLGLAFYPPRTIEQSFDWDPATIVQGLDPEQDIAGVEAAIWCETVTDWGDLLYLLLPRLPGVAQKAWGADETDWTGHVDRLAKHGAVWDRAGWNYFRSSLVEWS
jgi:hexosaminidase